MSPHLVGPSLSRDKISMPWFAGRRAGDDAVSRRRWRGRARAVFAVTVPALCALSIVGAAVLEGPARAGARSGGLTSPPTITSADNATFTVEQADSFTVTTTPGNDQNGDGLVALSEAGPLPDDVTFTDNGDGTASLAGTPDDDAVGSYPITITASNGVEPDATQDFTLDRGLFDPSGSEHGHDHRARLHQRRRCLRRDGVGTRSAPRADLHAGFRGTVVARASTPAPGMSRARRPRGRRVSGTR